MLATGLNLLGVCALAAASPFPGARVHASVTALKRDGGGSFRLRSRAPEAHAATTVSLVEIVQIRRAPLARRQAVTMTAAGALRQINASAGEAGGPDTEASPQNATAAEQAFVGLNKTIAAVSTANATEETPIESTKEPTKKETSEPEAEQEVHKGKATTPSATAGENSTTADVEAAAKAARDEMNSLKLCEDSAGVVMTNQDGEEMTCAQVKPFCKFLRLEVQTKCPFTCGFCGGKKATPPVTNARKAAKLHLNPPTVAPFVCADTEDAGFELKLSGEWRSASCGQLAAYCQSPLYGKDVARRCPVTCVQCVPYSANSPPCEDMELVGAGKTAEGLPLTCQQFKPFCEEMSMHARVQCPKTCNLCRPLSTANHVQTARNSVCINQKDPGLAFAFKGNLTLATCADLQPYCADMSQGFDVLTMIHAHCPETCGICGETQKAALSNYDQSQYQQSSAETKPPPSAAAANLGKDDEDPTLPPLLTTPEPEAENSGPSNFVFQGKESCTTRRRMCGFCACRRRDSPPNGLCATGSSGNPGPVSAAEPEEADEDTAEACPNVEDG